MVVMTHVSPKLPRRAVLAALAVAAAPALARAACPPAQVLFVCPYGTVKSAIARETLKRRAADAGLAVRVRSRGLDIQDHVTAALARQLKADGVDPAAEPPRRLEPADLTPGQIVVVFDEAAQDPRLAGARSWDVPSWSDYPAAKAALSDRIAALVAELRERQSRACDGSRP